VGGGNDQERARLERRAADSGVADQVSFAGVVADVAAEMARARVVALPSSCEGVPTALIEGMAAGRPVVATRTGHVASLIDDGVEGCLVDVGDIDALAGRLSELLGDGDRAQTMGLAARRRAASHDVRVVGRRLLGALCIAADRDRAPARRAADYRMAG
jgi:glycosyltransferase involved in cell wall biosynthesis